jgi:hypothetical protein
MWFYPLLWILVLLGIAGSIARCPTGITGHQATSPPRPSGWSKGVAGSSR